LFGLSLSPVNVHDRKLSAPRRVENAAPRKFDSSG
jgi:hypothetical protein